MHYSEHTPPPELSRLVERIWRLTGSGELREPRRVVPDGRPEIIFNSGAPFQQKTARAWRQQPVAFFAGQITGPLWLRPSGAFDITGVRLKPAAGAAIFGRSMPELADRVTPLEKLSPGLTLDNLGARAAMPDLCVEAAVDRLIAHSGNLSVVELARQIGWSPRHLQRRFLADVGLSPRVFARMQRFQRVFQAMEKGLNWAAAALECGYFDQGHLIRDFRELSGATPAALTQPESGLAEFFLQHRVAFFQDAGRGGK